MLRTGRGTRRCRGLRIPGRRIPGSAAAETMGSHEHSIGNSEKLSRKDSYEHIAGVRYIETQPGSREQLLKDGFRWPSMLQLDRYTDEVGGVPPNAPDAELCPQDFSSGERRYIFEVEASCPPTRDCQPKCEKGLKRFHDYLLGLRPPPKSPKPPKGAIAYVPLRNAGANAPALVTLLPAAKHRGRLRALVTYRRDFQREREQERLARERGVAQNRAREAEQKQRTAERQAREAVAASLAEKKAAEERVRKVEAERKAAVADAEAARRQARASDSAKREAQAKAAAEAKQRKEAAATARQAARDAEKAREEAAAAKRAREQAESSAEDQRRAAQALASQAQVQAEAERKARAAAEKRAQEATRAQQEAQASTADQIKAVRQQQERQVLQHQNSMEQQQLLMQQQQQVQQQQMQLDAERNSLHVKPPAASSASPMAVTPSSGPLPATSSAPLQTQGSRAGDVVRHNKQAVSPTAPGLFLAVAYPRSVSLQADNFLQIQKQNHRWLNGAVAELIHNSADADAKSLSITFEQNENAKLAWTEDRGADRVRLQDDGNGMAHEDINRMLMFGKSGQADDDAAAHDSAGAAVRSGKKKIGKYGIGFKQGAMRIAKSAVIISRSKEHTTTSYGLLSNIPFEHERSAERKPLRFVSSVVTVDAEQEPIEGCEEEDLDQLKRDIKVRGSCEPNRCLHADLAVHSVCCRSTRRSTR